jgi:uncharacterized protein YjiS (DUF1127 family)
VGKRPCSVPCPLVIGGSDFLGVHHSPYPSYMPLIRHALSWRASSLSSAASPVAPLITACTVRLRSRETARPLSSLTDRELSDIGISRGEIARAARQGR